MGLNHFFPKLYFILFFLFQKKLDSILFINCIYFYDNEVQMNIK